MKKEQLETALTDQVNKELYQDMQALFAKYGLDNIEIKSIEVSSKAIRAMDRAECEARGGVWTCKIRPGQPPYCRCLRRV